MALQCFRCCSLMPDQFKTASRIPCPTLQTDSSFTITAAQTWLVLADALFVICNAIYPNKLKHCRCFSIKIISKTWHGQYKKNFSTHFSNLLFLEFTFSLSICILSDTSCLLIKKRNHLFDTVLLASNKKPCLIPKFCHLFNSFSCKTSDTFSQLIV